VSDDGVTVRGAVVEIAGALTFDTVPTFYQGSDTWLKNTSGELTVDLQRVTRTDSAGVALMLEWLELAKQSGRTIRFTNLSDQIHQIIRVSGLERAFAL
jgi:phospholipid transport system transporter-binding protein